MLTSGAKRYLALILAVGADDWFLLHKVTGPYDRNRELERARAAVGLPMYKDSIGGGEVQFTPNRKPKGSLMIQLVM